MAPNSRSRYVGTGVYRSPVSRDLRPPVPPTPSGSAQNDYEGPRGTVSPFYVGGIAPTRRAATPAGAQPASGFKDSITLLGGTSGMDRIREALAMADAASKPQSAGGGDGGLTNEQRNALQAIATLRGRMGDTSQTDSLRGELSRIYGDAEARIRQAGTDLAASLAANQVAPAQYAPAMTVNPVAMTNYLSSIGASGADVEAQRQLSNALLQQLATGTQTYGQGLAQANDIVRQALAQSVPSTQLAGISQASLNRAALESRLAAQQAQERRDIENQILEIALKYGVGL